MGYLYLMMVVDPLVVGCDKFSNSETGCDHIVCGGSSAADVAVEQQNAYAACLSPILGLACSPIGTFREGRANCVARFIASFD